MLEPLSALSRLQAAIDTGHPAVLSEMPDLLKAFRSQAELRGLSLTQLHERLFAPPARGGMGLKPDLLRRLCGDDLAAVDALDHILERRPGNPVLTGDRPTIVERAPSGTSRAAGLRRLRREQPQLYEAVLAGKLSVNDAMIKANLRKKTVSVLLDPAIVTQLDRLGKRRGVSRARLLEDAIHAFVRDNQLRDAT